MTATAKIGALAAFWLAIGLVQTFNWGQGSAKALVLLLLLIATPFIMAAAQKTPSALPTALRRAVIPVIAILLLLDMAYLGLRIVRPHLIDIATTTLAAGDALLHGQNPYLLPIDTGPESAGYTGYKYLPVMIAAYLPLGALFGQRGVLLTNLAVLLACLWLMRRVAHSTIAPLLLLMLPLVSEQVFAKGATDLLPVLFLLGACALFERSPLLTGVCVGLSISAKLIPGALFLPCLIPPTKRWHYVLGIAIGLLPTLPFIAMSPQSFLDNVVWFNLQRVADPTSWLFEMPTTLALAAHLAMLAGFLAASVYVWRQALTLLTRCGLGAMLTLGAILAGPAAHHNYQLWWLPFYGVILARALAPQEACQESDFRYTSAPEVDARRS